MTCYVYSQWTLGGTSVTSSKKKIAMLWTGEEFVSVDGHFLDAGDVNLTDFGVQALNWTLVTLLREDAVFNVFLGFTLNVLVSLCTIVLAMTLITVFMYAIIRVHEALKSDLALIADVDLNAIQVTRYPFSRLLEVASMQEVVIQVRGLGLCPHPPAPALHGPAAPCTPSAPRVAPSRR